MFHVKPWNKLPTTCIFNWGPCFYMVQFIRDSSFMQGRTQVGSEGARAPLNGNRLNKFVADIC